MGLRRVTNFCHYPYPRFIQIIPYPRVHSDYVSVYICICRMDPNSSYRFAARVGAFVKLTEDGNHEYCDACNIAKVLDRDTTNLYHK
jgi:hypothetical protein